MLSKTEILLNVSSPSSLFDDSKVSGATSRRPVYKKGKSSALVVVIVLLPMRCTLRASMLLLTFPLMLAPFSVKVAGVSSVAGVNETEEVSSPKTFDAFSLVTATPPTVIPYEICSSASMVCGGRRRVVRIRVIFVIVWRLSNRLIIILAIKYGVDTRVSIKNRGKYTIFIDNFQI